MRENRRGHRLGRISRESRLSRTMNGEPGAGRRGGREKMRRRQERERERRKRDEHRLSKVQSSGHGAGHYMGFWGYGGGNRLPWDRSFSSSFLLPYLLLLLLLPPSVSSPTPSSARPTPEFIPGGCYGDAPSSEWRQGIQRRREL